MKAEICGLVNFPSVSLGPCAEEWHILTSVFKGHFKIIMGLPGKMIELQSMLEKQKEKEMQTGQMNRLL